MIGACSIPTGQASTHALHCMQAHDRLGAHAVMADDGAGERGVALGSVAVEQ